MLLPGCDRLLAIPPSNGAATDTVAIIGIYSIRNRKKYSLGGECGSAFRVEQWGYPPIGVRLLKHRDPMVTTSGRFSPPR